MFIQCLKLVHFLRHLCIMIASKVKCNLCFFFSENNIFSYLIGIFIITIIVSMTTELLSFSPQPLHIILD